MRFAEGQWPELQYNRKGVRSDGSTFFRREPDRLAKPEPVGRIDPRVPVLRLDAASGDPVALVVQYAGDPCVATSVAQPVISGDIVGYACQAAREQLGHPGLPIIYLQGAKGDVAVKYMFAGEAKARREGARLGGYIATLAKAAAPIRASAATGGSVRFARRVARLPLQPLPSLDTLRGERAQLDVFFADLDAGRTAGTDVVVGYDLPTPMPPAARRDYAERIAEWVGWAQRTAANGGPVRASVDVEVVGFAVGGVNLAATWAEVFGSVGTAVHERQPDPATIFACCCGPSWPDDPGMAKWAYVPGSADLFGNEYMTCFYRFTRFLTQYAAPAGDRIADCAVAVLAELSGTEAPASGRA